MMHNAPQTAVTLQDVANQAGVSLATASRVVNGSTRKVREDLRQRVLEAATSLGYSPNFSAQATARGSTRTVALVVNDISDPFFSQITAGVLEEAERQSLFVTTAVTNRNSDREIELIRILRGQRPRVIVIAGSRSTSPTSNKKLTQELRLYEETGGRVVLISPRNLPFTTLSFDNEVAAGNLARAIVERGYKSFSILAGPKNLEASIERVEGFLTGLTAAGIPTHDITISHHAFNREGGMEAAAQMQNHEFSNNHLIFCANDVMAIGFISAFNGDRPAPPKLPAIAGFGDIPTSQDITPGLTTVRLPLQSTGQRALHMMLGMNEVPGTDHQEKIPGEVIIRSSTPLVR